VLHEILTRHFFDGDTMHGAVRLSVEDGRLVNVEPTTQEVDFYLISPGLVDLQMNGFGANDVSVGDTPTLRALDEELAHAGTTSWCGTIVTAPLDLMSLIVKNLHDIWVRGDVPGFLGIHTEGPFLGQVPGAHRPDWIIPFDTQWLNELPTSVVLITVGAEQDSISQVVPQLCEKGILVSLGHSRPTKHQFTEAVEAGAKMVTHLFNGMSGVHHRDTGLALMALNDQRITAGLIGDLVHVSPDAIALAFAAKHDRGVCLVSDSIAWKSQWAQSRGIEINAGAPPLPDGTLAGSSTPLPECVARVVQQCGVKLVDALRAATSTPADLVGATSVGRAREGKLVDLIAFDESLHVVNTWRRLPSIRA